MPFKFHEPHRHRVPKARYRVRNRAECDRGLVQRGDVRVWISAEVEYLDRHTSDPKPLVWTKSAGQILEKVARTKQALESQH